MRKGERARGDCLEVGRQIAVSRFTSRATLKAEPGTKRGTQLQGGGEQQNEQDDGAADEGATESTGMLASEFNPGSLLLRRI